MMSFLIKVIAAAAMMALANAQNCCHIHAQCEAIHPNCFCSIRTVCPGGPPGSGSCICPY